MKRLIFLVFFYLLVNFSVCQNAWSETITSGTIVNQTWTVSNSPYIIEGDIQIAGLTIRPGVRVEFKGNYKFEVAGIISAIGTEDQKIIFTKSVDNNEGWQGIKFYYSALGSELEYCIIQGSINSGILIDNSEPTIKNCSIVDNKSSNKLAGGIYVENGTSISLENCTIANNYSYKGAGGVYVSNGEAYLINCTIDNNNSYAEGDSSVVKGGGIFVNGTLILDRCIVSNNSNSAYVSENYWNTDCYSRGGGIFVVGSLIMKYCKVYNNLTKAEAFAPGPGGGKADSRGGGIYIDGILDMTNSIIYRNSVTVDSDSSTIKMGSGIYIKSGISSIVNCTIAYNEYQGLINESGEVTVLNSIFWKNSSEQISGNVTVTYSDVQNGYQGEGNIDINPIFESENNLKIVLGSQCIDKGNPEIIFNDSSRPPALGTERNDMGAHGGPTPITSNSLEKPIAYNQSVSTDEGIPITITLNGFDPTGNNTLTYSIEKHPDNGVLTGTPPIVNYSPNQNFDGTDNFTFKVNNSAEDSNIANVSITIKGKLIDTDIYEPDNTYDTSKIIHLYDNIQQNEDIPGYDWDQEHLFETEGDQDWVKIHGVKNGWYTISVKSPEPECDAVIEIYNPDGETLLKSVNDYQEGQAEHIDFQATSNDIFYVKIKQSVPSKFGHGTGYHLTAVQSYLEFGVIIRGHVYVQSNHQPPPAIAKTKLKSSSQIGTCVEFDDGSFVMPHPSGKYTFIIEADGYISVKQEVTIPKQLTYSQNFYIVKDNNLPYANYFVEKTSGPAPLEVNFNEISSGKPFDLLEWDFGDGYTSAEEDPVHTYENAGNYTAKLTVARGNNQSVTEVNINVTSNSSENGGSSGGGDGGGGGGCFLSILQ